MKKSNKDSLSLLYMQQYVQKLLPIWLAVLAAEICTAYRVTPTPAEIDNVLSLTYETAWDSYLADLIAEGQTTVADQVA